MKVGIVGLGRMGSGIGYRLVKAGFMVHGYDPSANAQKIAHEEKIILASSLEDLASKVQTIWFLVPQGPLIDQIIEKIQFQLNQNTVLVDAGNSKFTDSINRAKSLAKKGIFFIDCGTSGGIHGKENGYSLMIGGDKKIYDQLQPQFQAIAAPNGYGYMGTAGAGHFVKMVHNGIEYGLLQSYAEGFELLREGPYKNLDLAHITDVWNHGSIIRSWLLTLAHDIFTQDQHLNTIGGELAEGGTGAWTVQTAQEYKIPVPVIEKSVEIRAWSRKTGGNFATKCIALLRNAFGGHPYQVIKKS